METGSQFHWWRGIAGDAVIRAGNSAYPGSAGIWRCRKGQPPQRIIAEDFSNPVTTPDGKWAVIENKGLSRLDLLTAKVIPVPLPPADDYTAICYVPSQEKWLIQGSRKCSNSAKSTFSCSIPRPETYRKFTET